MKISYDPEIDALYIRLLRGKHECRSIRLSAEVALNIGHIPAQICERCGEPTFSRETTEKVRRRHLKISVRDNRPPRRTTLAPA